MDERPSSTLPPTISVRVEGANHSPSEQLAGDVQREMLSAWQAGSSLSAEQWLDRHPEVKEKPEVAVLVIYEELCLREERGERVESAELFQRFPQYRDALSVVLSCHRLMHAEPAIFPAAGEEFGEFRLLREIGRGGAGRVFLATQPALSDRLLVVKLTPCAGEEHLSLARLQHTHIVPLFLVQEFPQRNLRALCMPFLGGASWSAILQALAPCAASERSGERIVGVLKSVETDLGLATPASGPAIGFLTKASYVQAVCWIGSCLAEGLHHAHERGLLHLDIKPSNVLVAADGQPMLLDFHLAHEVGPALAGELTRIGGTPGYMSPEQQLAIQAVRTGRAVPVALDRRSDIYSLGVLLYESLTGQRPPAEENKSRELLHAAGPPVSRSLEDLLHKCLAPDHHARYADAGELAADLRRHLANLPLRGVANRSLKERWQKWRRRKPHSLSTWTVGLAALVAIGGVSAAFYADRLQVARLALQQAEQDQAGGNHAAADDRLAAGLQAIRWLPGQQDLKQNLQRARAAGALHHLVEQLRFLDNAADLPPADLHELDAACRAIWSARTQIASGQSAMSQTGMAQTGKSNEQLDFLDLALLWTRLLTRNRAASDFPEQQAKAAIVLDEAAATWGPSPALALARQQLAGQPVSAEQFAALTSAEVSHTAWELDAFGRSLLVAGELEQAHAIFQRAIQLEPDAFWPNFHLTLCDYRLDRFDEALRAASVCVALSPKQAECFFNRGLCLRALGQPEAALADFTQASELDSSLGAAAFQRGLTLAELDRPADALDRLRQAAELGFEPARVFYEMALIRFKQNEWTEAHRDLEQSLAHDADYAPARALESRLRAEADATPSTGR